MHASPSLSSEKATEGGLSRSTSAQSHQQTSQGASSPPQPQQPDQPSLREQRRERRRELLEAAKHELEWRIIAARKAHDSEPASAASSVSDATAADILDAVPSTNDVPAPDIEKERKKEDLQRRIMRRRLRRAAREASRDPRLPENVWSAFGHYEVLLVKPTRTLTEVQKAVDEWYGHMSFRPNFKAELDMSKAAHVYIPFWHFACNTACQYQGRARIGRRFAAKYGEKTEGTLSTAFPVFICAEEMTPQRKPMLVQMDDLDWHEVWGEDRVVSLTGSEPQLKQALDEYLQPTDRLVDVGLQPHAAWQKEGRKRLEEVEIQMSEAAIIKAELARGILKPLVKGDVRERWEVDLDYVARTDQEREQGMGKVQLVLVPAYQLNYRWRGYEYHLCVRDGDDPLAGPPALEGTRPYSYAKISLAGLGGLGVGFACYWIITH